MEDEPYLPPAGQRILRIYKRSKIESTSDFYALRAGDFERRSDCGLSVWRIEAGLKNVFPVLDTKKLKGMAMCNTLFLLSEGMFFRRYLNNPDHLSMRCNGCDGAPSPASKGQPLCARSDGTCGFHLGDVNSIAALVATIFQHEVLSREAFEFITERDREQQRHESEAVNLQVWHGQVTGSVPPESETPE